MGEDLIDERSINARFAQNAVLISRIGSSGRISSRPYSSRRYDRWSRRDSGYLMHRAKLRDLPCSPAIHGTLHGTDIASNVVMVASRSIGRDNLLNSREVPRIDVDNTDERVPRIETCLPRWKRRKAIIAGICRDAAQIAQRKGELRHAGRAK